MSSIRIRTSKLDNTTEIKLLITHPMENGRNRDSLGDLIPAHFIQELSIQLNDTPLIQINMAGSLSKNPYFSFHLKKSVSGKLKVMWQDNKQLSDSAEFIIEESDF